MFNINNLKINKYLIAYGIGLIFLLIYFFLITYYGDKFSFIDKINTIGTIGIFIVTISLTFYIHSSSKSQSIEIDKKVKSIVNSVFLNTLNTIETSRTYFISNQITSELFSWQTLNQIEICFELLNKYNKNEVIKKNYQDKLIDYFIKSLEAFVNKMGTANNFIDPRKDCIIANFRKSFVYMDYFHKSEETEINLKIIFGKFLNLLSNNEKYKFNQEMINDKKSIENLNNMNL